MGKCALMDFSMTKGGMIVSFERFVNSVFSVLNTIGPADIIDIAIVTGIIFLILQFMKNTRSFQLLLGVVAIFVTYIVSSQFQLKTVTWLIESLLQVGFIALLVIFQPELRKGLEQLGNTSIIRYFDIFGNKDVNKADIDRLRRAIANICDGMERMSEKRTGALIVMEKFINLNPIKSTGTTVNADITPELIGTIFYDGSPLHDGAVVVQDGRIVSAGCVLPLSDNFEISKEMGTRHRAALGQSEVSDAVCLVVSEETGTISCAQKGEIRRNLSRQDLYNILTKEFIQPLADAEETGGTITGFIRRKYNEKR